MHEGKFGTAINCMDGRVQLPVCDWMKENYGLDYVDMITEPGPDRIVAAGEVGLDSVKARALISVRAHGSRVVAVAGHHDCAGNPVSEAEHRSHIEAAVRTIGVWGLPLSAVIGLWVTRDWYVEVVTRLTPP